MTYGDGFSVLPAGYRPHVFPVRVLSDALVVRHGTWRARMAAELWQEIYGAQR